MQLTIDSEHAGKRLDTFLRDQLPEHSRSWIQQAIKKGEVRVNDATVTPHHFIKAGDRVSVELVERPPIDLAPDPTVQFEVIAETSGYIVIRKPAGVVVHPAEGVRSHTLVNGLLARFPELQGIGEHPWRPGIVHRLDREASGLMLVARTSEAFEYYKNQFKTRQVKKSYLALVYGDGLPPVGSITFSIARSEKGRMASVPQDQPGSRAAQTDYEVLRRFHHFTLVRARTLTGRTHQVRVHFHGIGHPLVGDTLYRISQNAAFLQTDNLFLCADQLAFVDQQGLPQSYEIQAPAEWQAFLDQLSTLD